MFVSTFTDERKENHWFWVDALRELLWDVRSSFKFVKFEKKTPQLIYFLVLRHNRCYFFCLLTWCRLLLLLLTEYFHPTLTFPPAHLWICSTLGNTVKLVKDVIGVLTLLFARNFSFSSFSLCLLPSSPFSRAEIFTAPGAVVHIKKKRLTTQITKLKHSSSFSLSLSPRIILLKTLSSQKDEWMNLQLTLCWLWKRQQHFLLHFHCFLRFCVLFMIT